MYLRVHMKFDHFAFTEQLLLPNLIVVFSETQNQHSLEDQDSMSDMRFRDKRRESAHKSMLNSLSKLLLKSIFPNFVHLSPYQSIFGSRMTSGTRTSAHTAPSSAARRRNYCPT